MKQHLGIAMIELIFAIVIIAISVLTIPSMMSIADVSAKGMIIDEDVLQRMIEEIVKVSKARWDQNYSDDTNASDAQYKVLQISNECWNDGGILRRRNPDSKMQCEVNTTTPSTIPSTGNLNLTQGIEQLNNKDYNMTVSTSTGNYDVPVAYRVGYANSDMVLTGTTGTATWTLGSSSNMSAGFTTGPTHLKEVVVRTEDSTRNIDMTLTFFKSNVGKQ